MSENMDHFLPLTQFVAELMSPDTEVILYDARARCVFHVINPMDDEMVVGSEMRSLERSFLDDRIYERENFIVNYRALSKHKNKLKSATMFLRDDTGELAAMLTVNVNVDRLVELRDLLNIMVSGQRPYDTQQRTSFYNSFDVSIEGMVSSAIQEELRRYHIDPLRLSQQEKLEIVRNLDQKGIFLVKGAISELAGVLQTTETTIYRYLNKLSNME
ncbi:MAG: transcriptional regulator [Lachnospirales bacterium]